jgi:glycerol uptake facilitator protein
VAVEAEIRAPLGRRLGAEFLGTLLLVAVGTGAATAYLRGPIVLSEKLPEALRQVPEQLEIFNALLSVSLSDLVPVALAFAFILAVAIYAFGGVSGGHFNPAVTFGLSVARRFPIGEAPLYIVAQVLGGIAGAFLIAGIYGETGAIVGDQQILFGATVVTDGVEFWQATLAETLITFGLMMAIMAIAVDRRAPKGWSGLVIGIALGAGILVTGPITGGSANFARTLGPYVASLPFDGVEVPWGDLLVYALGPLVGATAAVFAYESLSGMERVAPAPSPGAATHDEEVLDVTVGAETTATAPREDPLTP